MGVHIFKKKQDKKTEKKKIKQQSILVSFDLSIKMI